MREQIAGIDAEITRLRGERDQEAAEAARQAARAEAERLGALASGELRAAITGVQEAARALVAYRSALTAAEQAVGGPVAPALPPPLMSADPWYRQVMNAWRAAGRGDVKATARAIVAAGDWQERDPAELARQRGATEEQRRQAGEEQARLRADYFRRHGTPGPYPNRGAPMPGYERVIPGTVHIDEYGRTDEMGAHRTHDGRVALHPLRPL